MHRMQYDLSNTTTNTISSAQIGTFEAGFGGQLELKAVRKKKEGSQLLSK